jgi:CRP/FNR family transcriptional regulator
MTREDFDALPEDDLQALRHFAERHSYPAGATLFQQGDRPKGVYIVEDGEVELVYEERRERLVVQLVRSGSSIGELPVLLETSYAYTGITRTPTTILSFSGKTIQTLIELHPLICYRWLRLVARRLYQAQQRLVELAGRTAYEQVAHHLLHEVEEHGGDLTLRLTQAELAARLALSRQTISRVLGALEQTGAVERGRGRLRVVNLNALRDHAAN